MLINEAAFRYLKEQDEGMFHEIQLPGREADEQEEDDPYEAVDEYFESNKVKAEMPYILMGELTFYTE